MVKIIHLNFLALNPFIWYYSLGCTISDKLPVVYTSISLYVIIQSFRFGKLFTVIIINGYQKGLDENRIKIEMHWGVIIYVVIYYRILYAVKMWKEMKPLKM